MRRTNGSNRNQQSSQQDAASGRCRGATERLDVIREVDLLASSDDVDDLANALILGNALPASEPRDAFHIAISAVNGVNYLLTRNFKHIANATLRTRINQVCGTMALSHR